MQDLKNRANRIVQNDPFRYSQKPHNRYSTQQFYGMICAIPVLFLVSLIFYIIASIEYELYFKEDQEVTMLSKSLDKLIVKQH